MNLMTYEYFKQLVKSNPSNYAIFFGSKTQVDEDDYKRAYNLYVDVNTPRQQGDCELLNND